MKRTLLSISGILLSVLPVFSQWAPLGSSLLPEAKAVAYHSGAVYAGGTFSSPNSVAKLNGTTWSIMGTGVSGGGAQVFALADFSGYLYVGGDFTNAGGNAIINIARWNGSTSAWSAVGNSVSGGHVKTFTVIGTKLYVGGKFLAVNNTSSQVSGSGCIATWDGTTWAAVGGGISGTTPEVDAIASMGTDVYAGGKFTMAGSIAVTNVAKWNGSVWSAVGNPGGIVYTLAAFNGSMYAGGDFGVKMWNGSSWVALGTGTTGGNVNALVNYNGALNIGGFFTSAGGDATKKYLARWNGSTWFSSNSGLNSWVNALKVEPSNTNILYVAGAFNNGTNGPYAMVGKYTTLVGIEEEPIPASDIRIYPNPAREKFTINVKSELQSSKAEMIVYNMIGKAVLQQSIIKNQSIDINCKELAVGIYFVKVMDDGRSLMQKIVIE
jgi:hypothetical protein